MSSLGIFHSSEFGRKASVIGLFWDWHLIVSGYVSTTLLKSFEVYTTSSNRFA